MYKYLTTNRTQGFWSLKWYTKFILVHVNYRIHIFYYNFLLYEVSICYTVELPILKIVFYFNFLSFSNSDGGVTWNLIFSRCVTKLTMEKQHITMGFLIYMFMHGKTFCNIFIQNILSHFIDRCKATFWIRFY